MRPKSILAFERLYLLAILIELARVGAQWPQLMQPSGAVLLGRILGAGVSLLLLLLASRRGRAWAALLLGGLFLFGLPMAAGLFGAGNEPLTAAVTGGQLALQGVALALLLRLESREWFASRNAAH